MARFKREFDIKRFLWVVIPFTLVAAFMLYMKPKDPNEIRPNPFPLYNLHLVGKGTKGTITLNGISIAHYNSGDANRTSLISLTPWLSNGENKLQITINQTGKKNSAKNANLKISLEQQPKTGDPMKKELFSLEDEKQNQRSDPDKNQAQQKSISKTLYIKAFGLPEWSWHQGSVGFHDANEIRKAVKNLHKLFAQKDIPKIRAVEKHLFQDMETLTGREGLERRQYRGEIILKGSVEPLGKLLIIPYAEGKVVRVTNKDGEAPIRIYFRYGNGGKVILTGQYWSKINGKWHVVR